MSFVTSLGLKYYVRWISSSEDLPVSRISCRGKLTVHRSNHGESLDWLTYCFHLHQLWLWVGKFNWQLTGCKFGGLNCWLRLWLIAQFDLNPSLGNVSYAKTTIWLDRCLLCCCLHSPVIVTSIMSLYDAVHCILVPTEYQMFYVLLISCN